MWSRFLKLLCCINTTDEDNESGSSAYYNNHNVEMYHTRLGELFFFLERRINDNDTKLRPLLHRIKEILNTVDKKYCKRDEMAIIQHFTMHLNTIYLFFNIDAAWAVKAINLTLIESMHGGHYDFCPISLCQEQEISRIDEHGNVCCDCNLMMCVCWDIKSAINLLEKICSGNLYWNL